MKGLSWIFSESFQFYYSAPRSRKGIDKDVGKYQGNWCWTPQSQGLWMNDPWKINLHNCTGQI